MVEIKITDSHIHYGHPGFMHRLISVLDQLHIERFNVVCTPHDKRLSLVPDALHLKAHYPQRIYVFGGLDFSTFRTTPQRLGEVFAAYAQTLLDMGCDGIKMIEGKPDTRKAVPIPPFDSPVYEPYWEKIETSGIPLVFHVNDPEEFWDKERVPSWALEQGWFYGDGTYINNEAQYHEVFNVLDRHPHLKVVFAHFFFFSAQLPRLAEYLDRYPNLGVDLAPGIEMFFNLSKTPQAARDFFIKYQDRIFFGTDIGAMSLSEDLEKGVDFDETATRLNVVRSFLERQDEYWLDLSPCPLFGEAEEPFRGLGLPQEALEKIYRTNFERLAGAHPKPLNPSAILTECERLEAGIQAMGSVTPGLPGDTSVVRTVKEYFKGL